MPQRTDLFDLGTLGLSSGEGRRLELHVALAPFHYGGEPYAVVPALLPVRLDVSRTTANGWALRLRFATTLEGPCMRCLEPARPGFEVDVREVHQPGGGEELTSPYFASGAVTGAKREPGGDELDVAGWAREALALELPAQLTCRAECAGLCGQCGANLNEDPAHEHESAPDPRWAKLSELRSD